FQGHHWRPDESEEIRRLATEAIRERQRRALAMEDTKQRETAVTALMRCESTPKVTNLLHETHNLLAMFAERWDLDPFCIGVSNGVVDLRTGALRPGRPEDHITRVAPVTYDLAATCPVWDPALEAIFPDTEVRACFDRALGYSLTGDSREEVF